MKYKKQAANMLAVWMLVTVCFFGGRLRLAWWSSVYPQSMYEIGAVKEEANNGEAPVMKWKLLEWLETLF